MKKKLFLVKTALTLTHKCRIRTKPCTFVGHSRQARVDFVDACAAFANAFVVSAFADNVHLRCGKIEHCVNPEQLACILCLTLCRISCLKHKAAVMALRQTLAANAHAMGEVLTRADPP